MLKPEKTVNLMLIANAGGRSDATRLRRKIDSSVFPDDRGVYRVRYADREVERLNGRSNCIRIGSADKGFRNRFDEYNHQQDITVGEPDLPTLLEAREQKTNVLLMHFLAYGCANKSIVVDLFYTNDPLGLEKEMLHDFLRRHYELPPLNLGRR